MHSRLLFICLCFNLFWVPSLNADIGDPTLRTDHPHYAGEGAFQTIEDCVRFAASGKTTPQDKAIGVYLWLLKHQWHLISPQEWNVSGMIPDIRKENAHDLIVADANRARFSYGYGLCGTVHAWNEPYWKALGMNSRRRAFPGHTNSEIEYSDSWHAFDTDMAGLIFRKDGIVAGYEDVVRDPDCPKRFEPPLPHYPFDWPNDAKAMSSGWKEVARGGDWFKMYNGGYAVHPGVIHLRSGESFTRYWDRDAFGGPEKRRFWFIGKGGPTRDWAFFGPEIPFHYGPRNNSRGNPSYSNGFFDYQPDLRGTRWKEGLIGCTSNIEQGKGKHGLRATPGGHASVIFTHFSPYVICGSPMDGIDPMTGPAANGFKIKGALAGWVEIAISSDQGQTWSKPETHSGEFEKDFTDQVKGHYGWWVRFSWSGQSGIDSIRFLTTTQVCQAIYPKLKPGGSTVSYRASSRAVVPLLPNLGGPETDFAPFEVRKLRSPNLNYEARAGGAIKAFQTKNNRPATVVFALESPTELTEIAAAGKYSVRVPAPKDCDFHWDYSVDGGQTWGLLGKVEIPEDNEHSSGWMSGKVALTKHKTKSALIRATLYGGGYPAALTQVQIYGQRETQIPARTKIIYAWKENGIEKTHTVELPEGTRSHVFQVPTGVTIEDQFVRIEAP